MLKKIAIISIAACLALVAAGYSTKEVTASIRGSRDVAEYRAAIDAALIRTRSR